MLGRKLFSVSSNCKRCRETIRLLSVADRSNNQHTTQQIPTAVPVLLVSTVIKRTEEIHSTECHNSTIVQCSKNPDVSKSRWQHLAKKLKVNIDQFLNLIFTTWSAHHVPNVVTAWHHQVSNQRRYQNSTLFRLDISNIIGCPNMHKTIHGPNLCSLRWIIYRALHWLSLR